MMDNLPKCTQLRISSGLAMLQFPVTTMVDWLKMSIPSILGVYKKQQIISVVIKNASIDDNSQFEIFENFLRVYKFFVLNNQYSFVPTNLAIVTIRTHYNSCNTVGVKLPTPVSYREIL